MRRLWISAGIIALVPALVRAEAGRVAGLTLNQTYGARSAGFARAYTAVESDLDSIGYNPAGLSSLSYSALSATYLKGFGDTNVGYVNGGFATSFGALYAGLSGLDAGTIELNQADGTTGSRRAQQDSSAMVGLSLGRNFPLAVGATAKFFRSELAETESATAFAADVGALWRTPLRGLKIGVAGVNLGSKLKYDQVEEDLPAATRVGGSYQLNLEESLDTPGWLRLRYQVAVDGIFEKYSENAVNAGLELQKTLGEWDAFLTHVALRAGYLGAEQSPVVGLGVGFRGLTLDYAISIMEELESTHRFTLGYRFGFSQDERQSKKEKKKEDDFKIRTKK